MCKRMIFGAMLCAMLALPWAARAAELADEDYVSRYFGTSIVFITAQQLIDVNQGYWGSLLPQEFMYSQGTLIDLVNNVRRTADRSDLLNPADYPIAVGGEVKRDDGKWEYSIDFRGCTPSEAQLVLDGVKFTGALGDCEREVRPLRVGYFYAQSQDFQGVDLVMQGVTATLTPEMPLKDMITAINEALLAKYGENCKADIYFSGNDSVTSGKAMYVNVTVYLDGAEKQFNYYGGEGEGRGAC
jgi:hypothetical protein